MRDIIFSQEGHHSAGPTVRKRAPTMHIPNGGGLDSRSPHMMGSAGKTAASAERDRPAIRLISHRNQEHKPLLSSSGGGGGPQGEMPATAHLLGERPMRRLVAGDPYVSLGPVAEGRRSPPKKLHPSRTGGVGAALHAEEKVRASPVGWQS